MSEYMDTSQFQQIIDEIKSVKSKINHLDGRINHLDDMSGIYLAGLVFILTGVGIYTNIVLMVQNLK